MVRKNQPEFASYGAAKDELPGSRQTYAKVPCPCAHTVLGSGWTQGLR